MARKTIKAEDIDGQGPAEPRGPKFSLWMLAPLAIVLLLVSFVAAVALKQSGTREPIKLPPQEMKSAAPATPAPAPWFYDSATNKHWDPNHNHWHDGRPPNQNQSQGQAGAPRPAPDIPNPEPWQYDAATNQHWNPEHNHWHNGQPPAGQGTEAPAPEPPTGVGETAEAPTPPEPARAQQTAPAPEPVPAEPEAAPTSN